MKFKIVAILTAMMFILQSFAFASYELGTSDDVFTINGTAEPFESVSFILIDADAINAESASDGLVKYYEKVDSGSELTTAEIFNFQTVNADENGNWSYTIRMDGIEAKKLLLVPSIGEAEYVEYASLSYRANILPILKDNAEIGIDSLSDAIEENISFITNKSSEYKKLTNKRKVAEYSFQTIKDIDVTSPEALDNVTKRLIDSIHVCMVAEGKMSDFDQCISIAQTKPEHAEKITSEGKTKTLDILKTFNYASIEEFCDIVKEQVALQMFNYNTNSTGDNLVDELLNNNDIYGLDFTEFNKLNATYKSEAAKALALKSVETLEDMQAKLDEICKDIKENQSSGSGSLGGSSDTGGGSIVGSNTSVPENKPHNSSGTNSISNEYIQEQKYIYSDMKDASWAADAVLFLSEKGIVSGYADKSFKPLNSITRAEFTKLVVETFFKNKIVDFSAKFKDVTENDWYGKYVNVAYNEGIVSGDENGYFNPDDKITRQDMAVIVYNAGLKYELFDKVSDYKVFNDDSAISDYAKDAVYTLKNLSVINGVGEGMFEPKANADRAAAAQILYSLMINCIK